MDGKEDYSDLPPNQKKKKLQAKVLELNKQVGLILFLYIEVFRIRKRISFVRGTTTYPLKTSKNVK